MLVRPVDFFGRKAMSLKRNDVLHAAEVQTSIASFLTRCMCVAVALQIIAILLFRNMPTAESIEALFSYAGGVIFGTLVGVLVVQKKWGGVGLPISNVWHQYNISERRIVALAAILCVPLVPDAINTLILAMQQMNVRQSLLDDPTLKIVDPKILMLFGNAVYTLVIYYFIFLRGKSVAGIVLMTFFLFAKVMIYVSRTEVVILLFFYFFSVRHMFAPRKVLLAILMVVVIGLFTIFVQGRSEDRSFGHLLDVVVFYSAYFGYPPYLVSEVKNVFGDYSIAYAILGYPIDVLETFFGNFSGEIARHLNHIATPSWVGFDLSGHEHYYANVLYPQYGLLFHSTGLLGVFAYYAAISLFIVVFDQLNPRYFFFWRVVAFVLIFESARSHAIGLPGTWFLLISALVFSTVLAGKFRARYAYAHTAIRV